MKRILVLDDDTAIRDSLLLFLEDRELEAVGAANADEAFDLLSRCPCDIAIVDLRLPGKTGEQFIIEAHERYPQLRFIIHTGSADYRMTPHIQRAGVRQQDIHAKPIDDLGRLADNVMALRALPRG